MPHRPERDVKARVVGVYGGVSVAGQNNIVSINRGAQAGLDVGSRFGFSSLWQSYSGSYQRQEANSPPDETYGRLFIFRVFKISPMAW